MEQKVGPLNKLSFGAWFTIALKEITYARRDKLLIILAGIIWVLLLVAGIGGYARYSEAVHQKQQADSLFRQEWEAQEANPHSAAHFGTYLFRPYTFLTLYDHGLNNYTGISYRVEAHKQHEVNYSTVQDTDSQLRFGELSVALVFQLLMPLLILIMGYGAISRECEHNTWQLLQVQGGSTQQILWGKIAGIYSIVLLVVLPALIIMLSVAWWMHQPALMPRVLAFAGAYLLYLFIITAGTVLISAWGRHSSTSMLIALGVWTVSSIILPRMVANQADQAAPLPSRYAFNRKIQEGYRNGMGKDGAVLERRKQYEQQVLKKYRVDSISQLPLNFDGLSMQYGEDYNAIVYKAVAAEADSIIRRQQSMLEAAAWANPFIAIQQVSMGMAGSDYYHHLHFHRQAQAYRDAFIRQLNMELAEHGGKLYTYDYKVGPAYFKKMAGFQYQLPTTIQAIGWHRSAWMAMVAWLLVLIILIQITAKKIH